MTVLERLAPINALRTSAQARDIPICRTCVWTGSRATSHVSAPVWAGKARQPRPAAPPRLSSASKPRAAPLPYASRPAGRPRANTGKDDSRNAESRAGNSNKLPLDVLLKQRRLALFGAGLAALLLGGYLSVLAVSFTSTPPPCEHRTGHDGDSAASQAPTGLPATLTRASATAFDTGLDYPEWLMGIKALRRRMASLVHGHVLEVAVGTGRNVSYYDWDVVVAASEAEEAQENAGQTESAGGLLSWAGGKKKGSKDSYKGKSADAAEKMLSFTGIDISADVLDVARGKIAKTVPGAEAKLRRPRSRKSQQQEQHTESSMAPPQPTSQETHGSDLPGPSPTDGNVVVNLNGGRLRLIKGDAQDASSIPPPTAEPKYDTILQTFGLCSVTSPSTVLANMAAVLRPGTGRIILLEHGRSQPPPASPSSSSSWASRFGLSPFVDDLLDRYAPAHFARFGCWWNRDIEDIVRDAARRVPGLEILRVERPYLTQAGTMLWIELRVREGGEAVAGGGAQD